MAASGTFYKGGKAGRRTAVTPKSLSQQAGAIVRVVAMGDFTQNATNKHNRGPLGVPAKLIAAYASAKTVPAGGTLSIQVVAYDASANGEVALTETLNPEAAGITVREGAALTLAATNVALAADDTIEIHCVASDNAVTQQQVDGTVTLVFFPTEDVESNNTITTGADLV